jgi:hypothetical protein
MVQATPQSRLASPELVGRREELGALEDDLGRAVAGEFRLVLLTGDAGVGKSRLGRELLASHPEVTGLVAQAYPLASSAAFGLWIEAVDRFLRPLSDDEVVELCGGLLDDLASLFHRVALVRGSVPERDPPLPRLLQGLAGLIGNVSRRRPLVVLLDDVHFADASSWQALRYFGRHLDDARLLVLATSRAAELAGHDVAAQVLFELGQDALLSRLEVGALPRAGLQELAQAVIGGPAPAALVDWLAERSQGNPLFAIGLLRALLEERGDLEAPHLRRLPEGLTDRVTSELRRFDAAPRGMLERLAVVGRPVSLGDMTTLTATSLEEVGPVLAELVEAGIVVEEERGSECSYELYHPLVRDIVYEATSGARRRVLHRQAGRSLLQAGHLAEAALHFARSAERGDSEAVEVLLDAMRQAERREAFREGARPAGRARRAAAGRRPALAGGPRGDVRARGVADRPPRRDQRPRRHPRAARDRRPARGLHRRCAARDRQVPPGQLPGLGHRRARAGAGGVRAGARSVPVARRPPPDVAGGA